MILTDYYSLERLPENMSKRTPRYDTTASTGSYPLFESMAARSRVKRFFCYYNGLPDSFSNRAHQKAERAITNTKNISSVFIPYLDKPLYGYGDVKGSQDAILFIFSADYTRLELFIARGYRSNARALFQRFLDGGLNSELEILRGLAK